jgi:hypothetical protein
MINMTKMGKTIIQNETDGLLGAVGAGWISTSSAGSAI